MIHGRLLGDSEVSYHLVPILLDGCMSGNVDADAAERVAEGLLSHGGW